MSLVVQVKVITQKTTKYIICLPQCQIIIFINTKTVPIVTW